MKKAIASVSLLALGAAVVQPAHADMSAGTDKPWTISGTLRGFYDDNYNTQPSGPGRVSSFGFEVRPSVAINYTAGPTVLTASYIYSAKYFDDRPGNKFDQSHDLELFLNHNFSERYSLDLEESFVDSQEPEVLDHSLTLPLRANGDNYRNTAGFNFHAKVTSLLELVMGYQNSWYDYTGAQAVQFLNSPTYGTLLNRFEHAVTLNSRWHFAEETTGIFGYTFGAVQYNSNGSIASAGNPFVSSRTRDNYSHEIYVGIEHNFRSDLTFSGRAGIEILDYYHNPVGGNYNTVSPFADLSLTYTYMDGGNVVLGFRNAKNQTDQTGIQANGAPTQDQESTTVSASINQTLTPLSPKLTASLSGEYQHSIYNGGTLNNEVDDFYLVGLNFTYQFTRYLSAEVGYNYDLLQSDIAQRGYDRNRVYIGVTASY